MDAMNRIQKYSNTPILVDSKNNPGFQTEAGYNAGQTGTHYSRDGRGGRPPPYIGSPLYKAVVLGDKSLVQSILNESGGLSVSGRGGWSVVTPAVLASNEDLLELLLKHGANPIEPDATLRTPLHLATYKGLDACLKLLVNACERLSVPLNQCLLLGDKLGITPLHHAAAHPSNKCLAVILKHLSMGMIDPQDHKKRTPLHWASRYGVDQSVALLVRHGANCHTPDAAGRTPLHWAVLAPRDKTLGEDKNTQTKQSALERYSHWHDGGTTSLVVYNDCSLSHLLNDVYREDNSEVKKNTRDMSHIGCINKLLHAAPSIINWQDYDGVSALHLAASRGLVWLVEKLLNHTPQADYTQRDNKYRTALHWSAIRGVTSVVRVLVRCGSDLAAVDKFGGTALHYAACYQHSNAVLLLSQQPSEGDVSSAVEWAAAARADEAVSIMVRHGARLVRENKHGRSWCPGLHVAARHGHLSTVALLLSLCSLSDSADDAGTTPLLLAVHGGHVTVVKHLLRRGYRLDQRDEEGHHALHCAVLAGHLYLAQLLLRAGTPVDVRDYYGQTGLHVASLWGHLPILTLLLELKADVEARDNQGSSCLHCAATGGHLRAAELLLEAGAHHSHLRAGSETPLDCVPSSCEDLRALLGAAGAVTASEVREMAATKLQQAWRRASQHRTSARQCSNGTTDAIPGNVAYVSSRCIVSVRKNEPGSTKERLKPVSHRAAETRVRLSHSAPKMSSCRHSVCGGDRALVRAARAHSSCKELHLPPPHELGLEAVPAPLRTTRQLSVNPELLSLLHHPSYGLSHAVQQPTNLVMAIIDRHAAPQHTDEDTGHKQDSTAHIDINRQNDDIFPKNNTVHPLMNVEHHLSSKNLVPSLSKKYGNFICTAVSDQPQKSVQFQSIELDSKRVDTSVGSVSPQPSPSPLSTPNNDSCTQQVPARCQDGIRARSEARNTRYLQNVAKVLNTDERRRKYNEFQKIRNNLKLRVSGGGGGGGGSNFSYNLHQSPTGMDAQPRPPPKK